MAEEGDRPRDEVRRLIDVVAVGKALLDSPQAKREAEDQQDGERDRLPARDEEPQRESRTRCPLRRREGPKDSQLVAGVRPTGCRAHIPNEYPATVLLSAPAMKLIIQIPCFNEEGQLPLTLSHLPRKLQGFNSVEWLVIDDGSSDRTVEVAREGGVDHVVRLTNHKGLAAAFQAGLDAGLKLRADVIVNTDGDNQYAGEDIPKLVEPILSGEADMVVGDRQVEANVHFSKTKRLLQRLGSWVVRHASSTEIPDTTSGFRAYNREAALQVHAVSQFTYTLETIIQAGKLLVAIDHVPVRTNPKTRESRLFPSPGSFVGRNALSIFRTYSQYQPLKVFWTGAVVIGLAALALFIRFLVFFAEGQGRGHIQSLIAGAVLFNMAMLLGSLGVIGDLLDAQRTLSQRTFEHVRRIELQLGVAPSHYEPGTKRAGDRGAREADDREALGV